MPDPQHDNRNIVLTGFMGTGKTAVGRMVAALLEREHLDTDELIVERHGPVSAIFAAHGEERFREIEREVAAELSTRERLVISTGGRLMLDPMARETLGDSAHVYCLVATVDEILERVRPASGTASRPLLAVEDPRARIMELLQERAEGYALFTQVPTSGRSPSEVAREIVRLARPEAS